MIELGVSQAQAKFTKILDKETVIVDKKTGKKKAVILPFYLYQKLLKESLNAKKKRKSFKDFIGVLDKDFKCDDDRYNNIIK